MPRQIHGSSQMNVDIRNSLIRNNSGRGIEFYNVANPGTPLYSMRQF